MIRRFFLFPQSRYLSTRWWHRLATVLFWCWIVVLPLSALKESVLDPWSDCRALMLRMQLEATKYDPAAVSWDRIDEDCGRTAWERVSKDIDEDKSPIAMKVGIGFVIVTLLYLALVAPVLLYRILLYIGKGSTWRDSTAQS